MALASTIHNSSVATTYKARRVRGPVAIALLAALILGIAVIYIANIILLERPLKAALLSDKRNAGIVASAHFEHYISPDVLVFDLRGISGENSRIDAWRVFALFAEQEQHRSFRIVKLNCVGAPRYYITGSYFQQLGRDYATENPVYLLRTFSEHVYKLDGHVAYARSDDSLSGLSAGIENFSKLMDNWCVSQLLH